MPGKNDSKEQLQAHKKVKFFLDESLPHQIADFLGQIGYPITSWYEEFKGEQGAKDPWLIPYLGGKGYTWITKDDEAKKEHREPIRTAQISIVWVRGLGREAVSASKNIIRVKDLHKMLTDKLVSIQEEITKANRPCYFLLYMTPSGKSAIKKIPLEQFFESLSEDS